MLSCGAWLAARPGCVVVTVCAGAPRDAARLTDWDRRSGFACAAEALAMRRREDAHALAALRAVPRWLDFADAQYGESAPAEAVAAALRAVLLDVRARLVLCPLGLFHADHRLVHDACLAALRDAGMAAVALLAYEDVPYRGRPGVLQQRLAELAGAGTRATPADDAPRADARACAARKARALRAYASQLRAFAPDGLDDATRAERFWRLHGGRAAAPA